MANPFKEAEKAKKKAPGSKVEHEVKEVKEEKVETVETPVAPVAPEEPVQPVKVPEVKQEEEPEVKTESKPAGKKEKKAEKAEPAIDIFAKLEAEKPSGKTYAFYLSDDNVAKLKCIAEKKKISASKLLDHILSEVL